MAHLGTYQEEIISTSGRGLLRLSDIIGPGGLVPVSKSTWWAGVKSGRFPQPVRLGPRLPAWRKEDILALIQSGVG